MYYLHPKEDCFSLHTEYMEKKRIPWQSIRLPLIDGLSFNPHRHGTIVIWNVEWRDTRTAGLRPAHRGQNRAICERDNPLNPASINSRWRAGARSVARRRGDAAQCARVPTCQRGPRRASPWLPGACDSARALSWKTVPCRPPFSSNALIHADNRTRLIAEDYHVLATRGECRRFEQFRLTHSSHALEEPLRYDEASLSSLLLSSMSNSCISFVPLVSFIPLISFVPLVSFMLFDKLIENFSFFFLSLTSRNYTKINLLLR